MLPTQMIDGRPGPLAPLEMLKLKPGMAHRLNLADNRLLIFDQSRLPITDIISPDFYRYR